MAGEYAIGFERSRAHRLLVILPLFDEANRLRRLSVEVMRRLDAAGIDSILPDLPGCNESLQPLASMTLDHWRRAMTAAAAHFRVTHVLAIRGGALVAPPLPGWHYAPVTGATILRQMIRARILSSREAGRDETQTALLAQGMATGLELAGYPLSAAMVAGLQEAVPIDDKAARIAQSDIGGSALWLRAEPDDDAAQADALAGLIAAALQC